MELQANAAFNLPFAPNDRCRIMRHSPWLIQIANELRERLPRVLDGMTLSNMWAYKYDSDTRCGELGTARHFWDAFYARPASPVALPLPRSVS